MGWKDTIQAPEQQGSGWRATVKPADEQKPKEEKGLLTRIADTVDSYTGAPVRAAIGAFQKDESPVDAYSEQFGEDPSTAPTGKQIAQKAGVSDRPIYDVDDEQFEYLEATDPMAARDMRGLRGVTKSGAAGLAVDVAADPTNAIGLIGPAAKAVGKGAQALGRGAKAVAETQAFRALGGGKAVTDKARETGNLTKIGRDLLDSKVVTAAGSRKKIAERIGGETERLGGELNSLIESAADGSKLSSEAAAKVQASQFVPSQAAEVLKAKIRKEYSQVPPKVLEQRLGVIDDWLGGTEAMNIKDAQAFKQQVSRFIKDRSYWAGNPNASQEALVGIRKTIKEGIEKNADAAAEVAGQAGGQIKSTNQKLGRMMEAGDIVDDTLSRDTANRMVSLTDMIAGAGGGATGDSAEGGAINGIAAIGANMLLRRYGRQFSAVTADKIGSALLKVPEFKTLSQQNPKAFSAVVAQIGAKQAAGSKAAPLAAVAERPNELDGDSSTPAQYKVLGPEREGLMKKKKIRGAEEN